MPESVGLSVRLAQDRPIPVDAEFECLGGEVLALVGPSGSGKSTILRAIAGLRRMPTARVICRGQTWSDSARGIHVGPQQRRVGFVFQDQALMPHLDALDNVALALGHLAVAERRRQAAALLARVNLHGLDRRFPAQLSGGQQQRVGVARALARDPAVLLLDEPFSAVDQVTRRKLRLEVTALMRELSIPVVLVTHDLDEAELLADRMCVIHRGRSLQAGPPRQLLRHPASAEVARLVDVRNLFTAVVEDPGPDAVSLRWGDLRLRVTPTGGFADGARVHWSITPGEVLLRRRDRPVGHGSFPNLLAADILELQRIGSVTTVLLSVAGAGEARLHMDLATHAVTRNRLAVGETVWISLPESAIHLMPFQPTTG